MNGRLLYTSFSSIRSKLSGDDIYNGSFRIGFLDFSRRGSIEERGDRECRDIAMKCEDK